MQAIIGPAEEEGDADSGISPARYFFFEQSNGRITRYIAADKMLEYK
jgi:hypothetical protein